MNTNYPVTRGISGYSWVITIGLDVMWILCNDVQFLSPIGVIVIPVATTTLFSACFLGVTAVQHLHVGESLGAAMKKGLVLGIVAAEGAK